MDIFDVNYEMDKFDQNNINIMLNNLGINAINYFMAMTRPSFISKVFLGVLSEFTNRYCIIAFNENEIYIIITAGLTGKTIDKIIKINRNMMNGLKLSNSLIYYMLKIDVEGCVYNLQVFKKVGGFNNIKDSLETFKKIYNQ